MSWDQLKTRTPCSSFNGSQFPAAPSLYPFRKVPLTFYYRHDTSHAMEKFQDDLGVMTALLGTESAKESSALPNPNISLKSFLQSLMHLPPAKQRTVVSELKDARNQILENQQNIKRDFRLLWNLYTISQQQASTDAIFSLNGVASNHDCTRRCFMGIHQSSVRNLSVMWLLLIISA
jgi:hypothetical protein